jgi:inorganic pyrophosphatase
MVVYPRVNWAHIHRKDCLNMAYDKLSPGRDVPNDINVVIEIPMNGEPIKYEVDKYTGAIFVDRFMSTAMHYPCNYGYIPKTLSGDGDPADVLVLSPVPLMPGVVVRCRPIGMLKMQDEAGSDEKLLAVPVDKLTSIYRNVQSPRDLPPIEIDRITHFFEHYKDLEPGKFVKVLGWTEAADARAEIIAAMGRFNDKEAADAKKAK